MTVDGSPGSEDTDLYRMYERLTSEQQALLTRELADRSAKSAIAATGREGVLRCSFAQERLWFLDQVDPGSAAYVMPAQVRLSGELDAVALRAALTEIVARHEALRTNFVMTADGVLTQVIRPAKEFSLPVADLRPLPPPERAAVAAEARRAEATTPFGLAHDSLIRGRLLRHADEEHELLLSMHHIVSDGWSLGVLRRELTELYGAYVASQGSPLPGLAIQYADFAAWQRRRMDDEDMAAQVAYWRERLTGAEPLELPADFPRPVRRSARGNSVPLNLSAEQMARIDELAKLYRATTHMVLLAAFAVVLWRWSGQDDLVIGTPVANRNAAATEPLIGLFVNTIALRLDLSADRSFEDLLIAARAECLAAYEHQEVPFERVVQETHPERATGELPLVRVMLALRNTPMPQTQLPGVLLSLLESPSETTKFDLTLDLVPEHDGGVAGRAEFSADLFRPDTVRRMAEALALVIDAALDDPRAVLSTLPIAAESERARMVEEFSGGGSAAPARSAGTLHGLFQQRVDEAPDALAVLSGETALTYRELDERANQLAWHLRSLGVGPEEIIGVSLPRSERMIVAVLAVLKAGGGYVPLDPGYPRRRVAYMAADAGVSLVITESAAADESRFDTGADGAGPRLVRLDADATRIAAQPVARPAELVNEANLAYVIYTSGSTGRPKGSVNEHGRVANTLIGMNDVYQLTAADRMLAVSSLNYDMSVYEVFGALAAGAVVVVPGDIETTDPEQLRELLIRQRVTAWSSAPALLDMLVGHCLARGGFGDVALRVVGLGGDRMPPSLPGRLAELVPGVRLHNLAGMTEVSYCTMAYLVGDPAKAGVLWGRPLPNHRIYVLDRYGQPVPPGVPGELYIGGAGPGRGYWRRPALTAQRFVPDPFSPEPGGRMYATGDHARFLASGELQFLGRLDQQIKIRGLRIELGEVEGALSGHPEVGEPVVLAYTDGTNQRRLAAYLTSRGETEPAPAELRRYLAERLPDHMVPTVYIVLDKLPMLPSGKLDRGALPVPVPVRPDVAFQPPSDALEKVLAGIWAELLGLDRIGTRDDFFDLGGHSLLATQAVSRTRELFRVGLSIPGFLAAGTVEDLAGHLRELATESGVDVDAAAELVLRVSDMSEEEAEGLLTQ
nr:non-ribosomal peptide synthetase [Kibdelosporangium sp. MJ126-NF4]CEL13312.1 Non-ribosomal peptide synthetase [Kibdelosporangium sp. MJ126-NF4]CTQ99003.1 Non-ribosomal peptide synthetase [Kibdelosporangium sp. MJ126-NF4]